MRLNREPNLAQVDSLYEALIALHSGRSPEESMRINARLIITLFNHIGDPEAIAEAITVAGSSRTSTPTER